MPSPAERLPRRSRLEALSRFGGLGALAALLAGALLGGPGPAGERIGAGQLGPALARWSAEDPPVSAHVRLTGSLPPYARDWLHALAMAGTSVGWNGDPPAVTALAVDRVADPEGAVRARVALASASRVILSDPMGALDSVSDARGGAGFLVQSSPAFLAAAVGPTISRASPGDTLRLGRILVRGGAGWESKFLAAALEERGWTVDAELVLAPRLVVRQGSAKRLDTANYSALILLDSVPADPRPIAEYVRSGGGLLLVGAAARGARFQGLRAGSAGTPVPAAEVFDTLSPNPRNSLGLIPILPGPESVVLERRGALVAVAARRVERGRVVTVGFDDTWRWRLSGGGNSMAAHREWWAGLVAQVAHVSRGALPELSGMDEAPLATLVDRLGSPSSPPQGVSPDLASWRGWLLAIALAGLLLEWGSRRLRGAR